MRFLLRTIIIYLLALNLATMLFSFIHTSDRTTLLATAVALMLLNSLGKPIIKVLWLPFNIITLGLFSWMVNVITIFLATIIVPGFRITEAAFPAVRIGKLLFPAISLNLIFTFLFVSFAISFLTGLFEWIFAE